MSQPSGRFNRELPIQRQTQARFIWDRTRRKRNTHNFVTQSGGKTDFNLTISHCCVLVIKLSNVISKLETERVSKFRLETRFTGEHQLSNQKRISEPDPTFQRNPLSKRGRICKIFLQILESLDCG